jgi:hypothetical protein
MQAVENKIEKLVIVCANYSGRATIYEHFYTFKQVEIKKDFESVTNLDCIIVPCPNAFGKATGLAQFVTRLLTLPLLLSFHFFFSKILLIFELLKFF